MSSVTEIQSAIAALPVEERAALVAGLCGWQDDDWDRQMVKDADAGRFDALNRAADAAHAKGETIPLDKILSAP